MTTTTTIASAVRSPGAPRADRSRPGRSHRSHLAPRPAADASVVGRARARGVRGTDARLRRRAQSRTMTRPTTSAEGGGDGVTRRVGRRASRRCDRPGVADSATRRPSELARGSDVSRVALRSTHLGRRSLYAGGHDERARWRASSGAITVAEDPCVPRPSTRHRVSGRRGGHRPAGASRRLRAGRRLQRRHGRHRVRQRLSPSSAKASSAVRSVRSA